MKLFILVFILASSLMAIPNPSILKIRGGLFSYYSSHPLKLKTSEIKKAIIIVHGSERNADTYYKTMASLALKNNQDSSTLVIAPHFKLSTDQLMKDELIFSEEGWLRGDMSQTSHQVSSFEVIDLFLRQLGDKNFFPLLEEIILTGHSAGGQLTQRFALGSMTDELFSDVKMKYIIANPGSYTYLNELRDSGNDLWIKPQINCRYNDYKFGLENLNGYVGRSFTSDIIKRYIRRDITYMVGSNDTLENIDQTCPAKLQGINRLVRGMLFKKHLDQFFTDHQHQLIIIPEVGHTQHGIYNSALGANLFFLK
jgi:hypothetical protein